MFKWRGILTFILMSCVTFSGCGLTERWRTFRERLREEDVIRDTKLIRDAEKTHKQKFERHGTMKDLIDAGLLDSRFEDGEVSESRFVLTLERDHYYLTVTPKVAHSETYNFTMYLDDTGIIRFSENPQEPANSKSYPLASQ